MPPSRKTTCKHCFAEIDRTERPKSMYCRNACRVAASRKKTAARRRGGKNTLEPAHVKKIKALAFNNDESEMANLVRAVFEDSVRREIDAHIRDNLLGMTEVLIDMAPEAVAALREDLASEDDYVRSRAYALWFKYIMPMQSQRDKEDDTAGGITVVLATPFHERVDAAQTGRAEAREALDVSDWLECYVCHTVKHPDAMRQHDQQGDGRHICTSCYWRKQAERGMINPTNPGDPLFS